MTSAMARRTRALQQRGSARRRRGRRAVAEPTGRGSAQMLPAAWIGLRAVTVRHPRAPARPRGAATSSTRSIGSTDHCCLCTGYAALAAELAALVGGSWVGFVMAVLALPVISPLTFRRCDPAGDLGAGRESAHDAKPRPWP